MLKKILPLVIVIAGGFYYLNGSSNSFESKSELKSKTQKKDKQVLKSNISKIQIDDSIKNIKESTISFEDLSNSKLDVAQRIELIEKNIKEWNRAETLQLEKFINSKNPYQTNAKPHSFNEVRMNEEAALRVHAMRRLAENLSEVQFYEVFKRISINAKDPQIRLVAKETIRYKRNGKSIHEEVINGVGSLPIPD